MSEISLPNLPALLAGRRRILVTGGAGFIGGAVVRRLLSESEALVFNLDKCGYASDLTSIEALPQAEARHQLLRVDLTDAAATSAAMQQADPDLVLHLAAEGHVDRSIEGPGAFIESNVSGTFHLLQAVRAHWEQLPEERREHFRFHHISTDEVFGSLGATGRFSETTPYDPRSPYSASKAASAHQLQQQLRPLAISREADSGGDPQGSGRRTDPPPWRWRQRARLALCGRPRGCAAAGGNPRHPRTGLLRWRPTGSVRTKRWWQRSAVRSMTYCPLVPPHSRLVTPVTDRPGHDRRYAIDPTRISNELGWQPRHSFEEGLAATVAWYLGQQKWCRQVREQGGYGGGRLGVLAAAT